MKKKYYTLDKQIEIVRGELNELVAKNCSNLTDAPILKKSRQLDTLISLYHKIKDIKVSSYCTPENKLINK